MCTIKSHESHVICHVIETLRKESQNPNQIPRTSAGIQEIIKSAEKAARKVIGTGIIV